MSKTTLCVLCGGRSAEHEVSLRSAANVVAAVNRDRYDVLVVGIERSGTWRLFGPDAFLENPDDPANTSLARGGIAVGTACRDGEAYLVPLEGAGQPVRVDIAFPVLHGTYGEDGSVQGLIRMLNIPYVGCDPGASANCMDKDIAKRLLRQAGVRVAKAVTLHRHEPLPDPDAVVGELGLPLFVKPARLGSSVGISKVSTTGELLHAIEEAFRFDTKILVEEAVKGREIEVAVLGNRTPRASVPGEIVPKDAFYSYKAKYLDDDGARLIAPAELGDEECARVRRQALRAFEATGCAGFARVDFFLTPDGRAVLNEINTIPGFTKISMYPRLWALSGVPGPELVEELIALAIERFREEQALSTDYRS